MLDIIFLNRERLLVVAHNISPQVSGNPWRSPRFSFFQFYAIIKLNPGGLVPLVAWNIYQRFGSMIHQDAGPRDTLFFQLQILRFLIMANPQKEDGYVAFANDLFDALVKIRIPGEARQCFDLIARKTYGWNKLKDQIALSQYVEATGIQKPHVCRSLTALQKMNMIIITKKGNGITEYAIQKDFEQWIALPKKVTLPKKVITVTQKGNKPHKIVTKKGTHKTKSRPTITKPSRSEKKIENIIPPPLELVEMYFQEKGYPGEKGKYQGEKFHDHYEMIGWIVGKAKAPMKDWKCAVRNWIKNNKEWGTDKIHEFQDSEFDQEEIKDAMPKQYRWCDQYVEMCSPRKDIDQSLFTNYFKQPTAEKLKNLKPMIDIICILFDEKTSAMFRERIKLRED